MNKIMRYPSWIIESSPLLCIFVLLFISSIPDSQSAGRVDYNPAAHHIVITCGSFRIGDLSANLQDSSILANESPGVWVLNADLTVDHGGKLIIDSKDVKWLKIDSPYGINAVGDLVIDSVRVTGWGDVTHSDTKSVILNSNTVMSINSTSGYVGSTLLVSGVHFAANSPIIVKYDGSTVSTNPSSVITSNSGSFTATFLIPFSGSGTHTVSVSDASSISDSKFFTVSGKGSGVFHYTNLVSGLREPVKLVFIPDKGYGLDGSGNFLVKQKGGQVIVIKNQNGKNHKSVCHFTKCTV